MMTKTRIVSLLLATALSVGAVAGDTRGSKKEELTPAKNEQLVINVTPDGGFVVASKSLKFAGLSAKLKELGKLQTKPSIIIRAPKDTEYDRIVGVLDVCKSAGLSDVAFATVPAK